MGNEKHANLTGDHEREPRKINRREVLRRIGGAAALAAVGGSASLISLDEIGATQQDPLSLPLSTKSARDLDLFVHALEDSGYRKRVLRSRPNGVQAGAIQLAELAGDEVVMTQLVDAGLAVFDFLSGERTKEELERAHSRALVTAKSKYPMALQALESYRLDAHPRYLEYAATQKMYNDWMVEAENGNYPLQRTSKGYIARQTPMARADTDSNGFDTNANVGTGGLGTGHGKEAANDPNPAFIGTFIGAILAIGAVATLGIWATVAVATLAVLALAVVPPSVTSSGNNPAWTTVG